MGGGWYLTTQMGNRSHTGESVKGTARDLSLASRMPSETLLTNPRRVTAQWFSEGKELTKMSVPQQE